MSGRSAATKEIIYVVFRLDFRGVAGLFLWSD